MRTTLILNDELLKEAQDLTGVQEKTALVHLGLRTLIQQKAQQRLISLGGSDKKAKSTPRKRLA